MKVTAQMSVVMSILFAAICIGFAWSGFSALADIADPQQLEDARGFAWFWTGLATVAVVVGAISWWLAKTTSDTD
jgi:hypothetical protein